MITIKKTHLIFGLYLLFSSVVGFFMAHSFPQETRLIFEDSPLYPLFAAGALAFIAMRYPVVGIGSIFVIMLTVPELHRNNAGSIEHEVIATYYLFVVGILMGGAYVGLHLKELNESNETA